MKVYPFVRNVQLDYSVYKWYDSCSIVVEIHRSSFLKLAVQKKIVEPSCKKLYSEDSSLQVNIQRESTIIIYL